MTNINTELQQKNTPTYKETDYKILESSLFTFLQLQFVDRNDYLLSQHSWFLISLNVLMYICSLSWLNKEERWNRHTHVAVAVNSSSLGNHMRFRNISSSYKCMAAYRGLASL